MKKTAPLRGSLRRQFIALVCLVASPTAWAQFAQTGAGPYDYATTANWIGGTINNAWSTTLTANQTITFSADYTLVDPDATGPASATLSLTNSGTFNQTFIGSGGNRTLTLGNSILLASNATNTNTVTLGSTTDGQRLNVDLGSASRTLSVGTNRTLEMMNIISSTSGTFGITKIGAGTLVLANTANTFTGSVSIGGGSPSQFGGVLVVTKLADKGAASSIGAGNGNLTFGGANGAATLRYVGAGDTSNRTFVIGGQGAIFDASGTGALQFTSTGAIDVSPSNTVSRTLTFDGTNISANTFAGLIRDPSVSAQTSVLKSGAGRWILSGNNTYTGTTTIDAGTLELGASNRISDSSNLVLNGGTFATGGFDETFGTLDLNGDATIDFGSSDVSDLVFSASDGVSWGASVSLSIINFTEGFDSIRFGTTFEGLSIGQLGKITINGFAAAIDEQGYLSAIPEPSSFAAFAGLGVLGLALNRRRPAAR